MLRMTFQIDHYSGTAVELAAGCDAGWAAVTALGVPAVAICGMTNAPDRDTSPARPVRACFLDHVTGSRSQILIEARSMVPW